MKLYLSAIALLIFWCQVSVAGVQQVHLGKVKVALNHHDVNSEHFDLNYSVNIKYLKGNLKKAPVLYYACSHSYCDEKTVDTGYVPELATAFGAVLVSVNERFIKDNVPKGGLQKNHLRYFNFDQIAADLNDVQVAVAKKYNLKGPWLVFGFSMGGSMAAYYRIKYPAKTVGAWASSPALFFDGRYDHYSSRIEQLYTPECFEEIQKRAYDYYLKAQIAETQHDQKGFEDLKAMFGMQSLKTSSELLLGITGTIAAIAQYDFDENGQVKKFCENIKSHSQDPNILPKLIQMYKSDAQLKDFLSFNERRNIEIHWPNEGFGNHPDPQDQFAFNCLNGVGRVKAKQPYFDIFRIFDPVENPELCESAFGIGFLPTTQEIKKRLEWTQMEVESPGSKTTRLLFVNGAKDPWLADGSQTSTEEMLSRDVIHLTFPKKAHCWDSLPSAWDSPNDRPVRDALFKALKQWMMSEK